MRTQATGIRRWGPAVASSMVTVALCGLLFVIVPVAEQLAAKLGEWAPAAFIAVHASTVVVVPLPAWPVTAVDAAVYGGWVGFGLSMTGTVLGSIAMSFLGRKFGRQIIRRIPFVERVFGKYSDTIRGSDGLWLVPLLALPIPMAGDVGCFLAGLTKVGWRRLVLLTVAGRIPGNALGVLGTIGVATGSATALVAAAGLAMLLMLWNRRWQAARALRVDSADTMASSRILVRERIAEPDDAEPDEQQKITSLPRPLAFVFGAGGSHGAVHVGQLLALQEHGVRPDLLVGCSVGALNAAVTAHEPEMAASRLDNLWRQARGNDLFCRSDEPLRHRRAVFANDGLRRLAEQALPADIGFEDLSIPLFLLAGEGRMLRRHILGRGPLLPAMLASCALPLLLPSITIDGTRLVDGGVRHALPIGEAFELGAASVIALPTTRWPRPIGYRASGPVGDPGVVTLGGACSPGTGWTFSRTSALVERGYRATSDQLAPTYGRSSRLCSEVSSTASRL